MIGQNDPGGSSPVISLDGFNIYPGGVQCFFGVVGTLVLCVSTQ